jgi:Ca2+-binding EF-hand superfamily protein
VYKNGDVNGDDVISITDAVSIVNYIMGNPSENFIEEVANVNDEGEVSITDAVGVVNIIMDNGASMAPKMVSAEPQ